MVVCDMMTVDIVLKTGQNGQYVVKDSWDVSREQLTDCSSIRPLANDRFSKGITAADILEHVSEGSGLCVPCVVGQAKLELKHLKRLGNFVTVAV